MINKNELMVGSVVRISNLVTTIAEICFDFVTTDLDNKNYEYPFESLHPVMLSDEIFLSYGFKKELGYAHGVTFERVPYYINDDITIVFDNGYWISSLRYDGGNSENMYPDF